MGEPFVLLLLLTFGVLLAVLGAFMLIWSRGAPRIYGSGFLVVGIVVLAAMAGAILGGIFLDGVASVMDVLIPAVIYLLAIAAGAVLAVVPFLVVALRT